MGNKNILVVFGAPNHEEQLARLIAEKAGCQIATATCNGKPVHPGNAYKADGHSPDGAIDYLFVKKIILVGCSENALGKSESLRRVECITIGE